MVQLFSCYEPGFIKKTDVMERNKTNVMGNEYASITQMDYVLESPMAACSTQSFIRTEDKS